MHQWIETLAWLLTRGEQYLKAGADGIYVEAPASVEQSERIGAAFKGMPQMTNMFEGENETPWLTPMDLSSLGFSMILYPTSLLFRATRAIEGGLADLRQGKQMAHTDGIDLEVYEAIVDTSWSSMEKRFGARQS